jgi:CBS domain-containing protein
MPLLAKQVAARPMVLRLSTAAELMTRDPLSFDRSTPIHKAAALLEFHNLDAAPVVDDLGRPIGVVSKRHCADWREYCLRASPHGFVSEDLDHTTVDEIMNPAIELVHADDASRDVIEKLSQERLRRAYVVNDDGQLVGVVSSFDVLRHLAASDGARRVMRAGAALLC